VLLPRPVLIVKSRTDRCLRFGGGEPQRAFAIGFVPWVDRALPITVPPPRQFAMHGRCAPPDRKVGWVTVRQKLLDDDVPAARAPVSTPFATPQ